MFPGLEKPGGGMALYFNKPKAPIKPEEIPVFF